MSNRTVTVALKAVTSGFDGPLVKSTDRVRSLQDNVTGLTKSSKVTSAAWNDVGKGLLIGGAAISAGIGATVVANARFEKSMSGVKAVANATSTEMRQLSAAALKAGADTVFSASQAADAEAELAKAGVEVKDILGGALTGALSLAAAGQLELADAATVSAQAMNVFDLEGKDVAHIADVLASAANDSAADVKGLGDALKQGGLVAKQTGLDLEDTVGTLAAFADNALIGSDAGTALKTMLQRLTPQSAEAADKMAELGISAYDSQGQFIGLEKFAGSLQQGLANLTDEQKSSALATIFGSDAVRAAAILYDQGEQGIRSYIEAVNDQGAAARMAATQLDNLSGDVEALKGSVETALIQSGSGANKVMRELVQTATAGVNVFNELPGPVQQGATGLAALAGAATLAGGAAMIGVAQVRKFRDNLAELGFRADHTARATRAAGVAMKGIAVAGTTVALLGVVEQLNTIGAKQSALPRVTEGLVDLAQQGRLTGAALDVFGQDFEKIGKKIDVAGRGYWTSFTTGQKSIKNARTDLEDLDQALAGLVSQGRGREAAAIFERIKTAAKEQGVSIDDLNKTFDAYSDALSNDRTQQKLAGTATDGLTAKIDSQTESAKESAAALRTLADRVRASFDPIFAAQDATTKQTQAQRALNDAIRKYGRNSAEARDAQQELLRSTVDLDGAVVDLSAGLREGSVSLADVNARLDGYVRAGLLSATQARRFRDQLADVAREAGSVTAKLGALGSQHPQPKVNSQAIDDAQIRADRLLRRLGDLDDIDVTASVRVLAAGGGITVTGGSLMTIKLADGGLIPRSLGGPRQDNVRVLGSGGEYVVNERATSENLPLLQAINSGAFRGGPVFMPAAAQAPANDRPLLNIENFHAVGAPGERMEVSAPRGLRNMLVEQGLM